MTNQKWAKIKYKAWFCEKNSTENANDSNALPFIVGLPFISRNFRR